jgi:uncharacterized protein (DUF4415 family)
MQTKKGPGVAEWVDPDDAPPITDAFFDEAEVFDGDRFVRRGPGRPRVESPKEQINIRLDADVLSRLRQNGPGWQTKINEMLRASLGLPKRDWAAPSDPY